MEKLTKILFNDDFLFSNFWKKMNIFLMLNIFANFNNLIFQVFRIITKITETKKNA